MAKRETNIVKVVKEEGSWGWVLFLAYAGAAVYFFNLDPTFLGFFIALFKAIFWPAFVLYEVLGLLQVK